MLRLMSIFALFSVGDIAGELPHRPPEHASPVVCEHCRDPYASGKIGMAHPYDQHPGPSASLLILTACNAVVNTSFIGISSAHFDVDRDHISLEYKPSIQSQQVHKTKYLEITCTINT